MAMASVEMAAMSGISLGSEGREGGGRRREREEEGEGGERSINKLNT